MSPLTPSSPSTPLTGARKALPSFEVTFEKLLENLEGFDVAKVRYEEIARPAITTAPPFPSEGEPSPLCLSPPPPGPQRRR
jgi:hypothetical protein